ncbi:hypothetical protein F5Y18DRAFT_437785 [Xylariaceae sp. FL1019]|nr:hypothetical protein F5Y18DRAFT_437785 [Xylariaceae sp. FL1019]
MSYPLNMDTNDPDGPVLPPPDVVESNFDHSSNGNALVIALASFFLALATFSRALRIYATLIYQKNRPAVKGDTILLTTSPNYVPGPTLFWPPEPCATRSLVRGKPEALLEARRTSVHRLRE